MLYVCVESTSECRLLTCVVNYGNGCLRLCEMFACVRLVHNTLYVCTVWLYGCGEVQIIPPDVLYVCTVYIVCLHCMAVWLSGGSDHPPPLVS